MIRIRAATEADLDQISRIQSDSPEASRWNVAAYLSYSCLVAVDDPNGRERIAGFLVTRETAPGEREILNIAVDAPLRRRGVARDLVKQMLDGFQGSVFLEVRQSNLAARKLYHSLGFEAVGIRKYYYGDPEESAIVMKILSC